MQPQFITLSGRSKDITGEHFGRLIALGPVGRSTNTSYSIIWLCRCQCGNEITTTLTNLRGGDTQSCGCLQRDTLIQRNTTHGMTYDPLYSTWSGMLQRCYYPDGISYPSHGGRGIAVCDDWRDDFSAFHAYVTQLPDYGVKGYSLDRIDNDGDYEPGNVRWATQSEQCRNKRNNTMLTYNDKTQCVADWANAFGIDRRVLAGRIRRGWAIEQALTTPQQDRK